VQTRVDRVREDAGHREIDSGCAVAFGPRMAAIPISRRPASSVFSRLLLAVLGLLPPGVLVAVRATLDTPGRVFFEAKLLYFTMPVVVGLAAMAAVWRWRAVPRSQRSAAHLWPGAVAAVVLTTIVFALVPPRMRVQFDETSLVSVSQNMHLQRAALLATGAVPFEGGIVPIENMMDKRPPLFAFLVSLLHDVSGYRIENAFAVNAGLLATALLLVFAAARRHLPLIGALAAPFLLLAVPLTTLVATSAGFELLAAVLFTLVLLSALDFVRQPDTVRFVGFLASGVLFAESRYESLPALGLIAVIVAWSVRRRFRPDRRALVALAACPALVTPLVFLLLHSRNPNFYPEAGGQDLVSLQHGLEHAGPFLFAWFWPLFDNALPGVLSVVAVFAYGTWLRRGRAGVADAIVVVPVLGVTIAVLCWFFSDVREPMALRLFLPLAWLTAQAPLLLPALFGRRVAATLLAAAVVLCGVQLHAVHRGARFPRLYVAQLMDAIDAMLREVPHDSRTLWVGMPAQYLIVKGNAALTAQSFMARGPDLEDLFRRGRLKTVYVIETPIDATHAPAVGDVSAILAMASGAEVVSRSAGATPIVVHRLRLR